MPKPSEQTHLMRPRWSVPDFIHTQNDPLLQTNWYLFDAFPHVNWVIVHLCSPGPSSVNPARITFWCIWLEGVLTRSRPYHINWKMKYIDPQGNTSSFAGTMYSSSVSRKPASYTVVIHLSRCHLQQFMDETYIREKNFSVLPIFVRVLKGW